MDDLRGQFLDEGRDLVQSASADLLAFVKDSARFDRLDAAFRAIHTLKGATGLFDLRPLGDLLHAAEDVLGALRAGTVRPDATLADALLDCIDLAARWLDAFAATGALPDDAVEVGQRIGGELRRPLPVRAEQPSILSAGASSDEPWVRALVAKLGPAPAGAPLHAVRYVPKRDCFFNGDDPVALVKGMPGLRTVSIDAREPWVPLDSFDPFACNLVLDALSDAPLADLRTALRLVVDQVRIVEVAAPDQNTQDQHAPAERGPSEAVARDATRRSLRIDAGKVDTLAGLVDELVAANTALTHVAGELRRGLPAEALAPGILASQAGLDRLTGALHRAVMQIRLVPLASLFRRFPRLVREIEGQLGKELDLVLQGEAIEVDKSLVDGLFEPILHLIRNAADHGIEPAALRHAAGKPVRGSITLSASRVLDMVVIEVGDDGGGIDPARVRRKAAERGLVAPEAEAELTDREAIDLLFTPGFSTASAVTELSGRGVGLDAVRMAVAQLGGRVAVSSRLGTGTSVQLTLPASIVLTGIVTVQCGAERFGVPIDGVIETLRLPAKRALAVRHGRAFVFRDAVLPIFALSDLLGLPPSAPEAELKLLVFGRGDAQGAVAVDEFGGRQSLLLRPLHGLLSGMKGIAGTALLGDGRVMVVLDLPELVE
jgi:two-component system chemotaxis sensor kinase CheA